MICITVDRGTLEKLDEISKLGINNKSAIIRWAVNELYDKLINKDVLKGGSE